MGAGYTLFEFNALVAQWIEQDGPNVKVGGSIPSGGANRTLAVASVSE